MLINAMARSITGFQGESERESCKGWVESSSWHDRSIYSTQVFPVCHSVGARLSQIFWCNAGWADLTKPTSYLPSALQEEGTCCLASRRKSVSSEWNSSNAWCVWFVMKNIYRVWQSLFCVFWWKDRERLLDQRFSSIKRVHCNVNHVKSPHLLAVCLDSVVMCVCYSEQLLLVQCERQTKRCVRNPRRVCTFVILILNLRKNNPSYAMSHISSAMKENRFWWIKIFWQGNHIFMRLNLEPPLRDK